MKRSKISENVNGGVKKEEETNLATEEDKKQDNCQKPPEPPKDYIHVRARRGQATDSHSLAERVSNPAKTQYTFTARISVFNTNSSNVISINFYV